MHCQKLGSPDAAIALITRSPLRQEPATGFASADAILVAGDPRRFFGAAALVCLVLRFALSGRAFDVTGLFYVLTPFHTLGFHLRSALGASQARR
ncbi:MAG: hypothetical protein JST00_26275 [Deltaproteobacteria bacterium]|nr:hypothetical protein [Deltaproteobacteria bacterium]